MREMEVLFIFPPELEKPAIAIAAFLAEQIGRIDDEYNNAGSLAMQISNPRRSTDKPFGIKVGFQTPQSFGALVEDDRKSPAFVSVSGGMFAEQKNWIAFCNKRNVRVLSEAVSNDEAKQDVELQVDTIGLNENEAAGRVAHDTSFIIAASPLWF